jgi:hypothetical protein
MYGNQKTIRDLKGLYVKWDHLRKLESDKLIWMCWNLSTWQLSTH